MSWLRRPSISPPMHQASSQGPRCWSMAAYRLRGHEPNSIQAGNLRTRRGDPHGRHPSALQDAGFLLLVLAESVAGPARIARILAGRVGGLSPSLALGIAAPLVVLPHEVYRGVCRG